MNSDTKPLSLPSLTADLLSQTNLKIDNTFSSTWKSLRFSTMLRESKFYKRSGTPAAIVRMKKNKIKYRLMINGTTHLLCAQALYKQHVKGHW